MSEQNKSEQRTVDFIPVYAMIASNGHLIFARDDTKQA